MGEDFQRQPSHNLRMARIRWTKEMTALLGTMSDGQVAKRLNLPKVAVASKRRRMKIKPGFGIIAPPGTTRPNKWGQTELGRLRFPDAEVARMTGRTIAEIKAKRAEVGG
jgi:hypothetical protein